MGIFTPGPGFTGPVVVAGINLTTGAQGQPVMNRANNNRVRTRPGTLGKATNVLNGETKSVGPPSVGFQQLDSTILSLDATYDQLPNQSDWIIFAALIAGLWDLCANCNPGASGKKLYRQYNFNRALIGLPSVGTPVNPVEVPPTPGNMNVFWDVQASPAYSRTEYNFSGGWDTNYVLANVGFAQANPIHLAATAENAVEYSSGPVFEWVTTICTALGIVGPTGTGAAVPVKFCCFSPTGCPGPSYTGQASFESH